jgi:hypothetical protein
MGQRAYDQLLVSLGPSLSSKLAPAFALIHTLIHTIIFFPTLSFIIYHLWTLLFISTVNYLENNSDFLKSFTSNLKKPSTSKFNYPRTTRPLPPSPFCPGPLSPRILRLADFLYRWPTIPKWPIILYCDGQRHAESWIFEVEFASENLDRRRKPMEIDGNMLNQPRTHNESTWPKRLGGKGRRSSELEGIGIHLIRDIRTISSQLPMLGTCRCSIWTKSV